MLELGDTTILHQEGPPKGLRPSGLPNCEAVSEQACRVGLPIEWESLLLWPSLVLWESLSRLDSAQPLYQGWKAFPTISLHR